MFPAQLMNVLEKEELSGIISWLSNGKGFVIIDRKGIENVIMPKYFNQGGRGNFSSFSRRLRRWGFRIERGCGVGGHKNSIKSSSCFHPMFVRGRPELCERMTALPQARTYKKPQQIDKKRWETSITMDTSSSCATDDKNSLGGTFPLGSTSQTFSPKRSKIVHTAVPSTSQHHSSYGVERFATHSSPTITTVQHQKLMSRPLLRQSLGVGTSRSRHFDGFDISRSDQARNALLPPPPMQSTIGSNSLMQSRMVINYVFPTTSSRMISARTIQQNNPGLLVDNYAEESYLLRQREEAVAAIHLCTVDKNNQQMRNQFSTLYRWHPTLYLPTAIASEERRRSLHQEEQEQVLFKNHQQHLLLRGQRGEMLVAHTATSNARNKGGFATSRISDDDDESLAQALIEMRSQAFDSQKYINH